MHIDHRSPRSRLLLVAASALVAAACQADSGQAADVPSTHVAVAATQPAATAPAPVAAAGTSAARPGAALAPVLVHKSPSCGCCGAWVEHMRAAGFTVQVNETEDLGPIKDRLGVPAGKGSCHTAEVGGYLVEGHVPAADIKRLLDERPNAKGLVLAGMPIGSPGMESPDGTVQPYTVELVAADGQTHPYARHAAEE